MFSSKLWWPTLCLTPFLLVFLPLFSFIPPSPHHSPTQPLVTCPPPSFIFFHCQAVISSPHSSRYISFLPISSFVKWKTLVLLTWLNHLPFLSQILPLFYFILHLQSFWKVAALFASPLPQLRTCPTPDENKASFLNLLCSWAVNVFNFLVHLGKSHSIVAQPLTPTVVTAPTRLPQRKRTLMVFDHLLPF